MGTKTVPGAIALVILAGNLDFPRRVQSLTASIAVLLGLQFLTIHLNSPFPLPVFHPLIGFTLFSVSTTLVHRLRQTVFGSNAVDISQS
jgi:formate-dependent nitrite reductase membrane component NrfD